MAAVSALLTLPFLFAAAIQALMRSDLSLLLRSAFGYLPLGMLGVAIAAPVTTLLLAGSDELSHIVSSAASQGDSSFLHKAAVGGGALILAAKSPFLAFFVGLLTAAAALILWCELLIRSAAVYVIVLMLPLFFAALVWPARRVWAVRAVEVLVALILSKFAIVAILALGGAAITHSAGLSFTAMLAGATLLLLAAFSPWALLRMLPLHELAAGAAGGLRSHMGHVPLEPAESATTVAQTQADRLLGRGEAVEEAADQAYVDRAAGSGEPEPRRSDDADDGGEAITDADAVGVDESGEVPPVAAVDGNSDRQGQTADEGSADDDAGCGEANAAASPSPGGEANAAASPSPGGAARSAASGAPGNVTSPSASPDGIDSERAEELGHMVRPGQTLHLTPQPQWSPEDGRGPANSLDEPGEGRSRPGRAGGDAVPSSADEPLTDDHDPLPPPQEPEDGRL
jgi:hypothetical protein